MGAFLKFLLIKLPLHLVDTIREKIHPKKYEYFPFHCKGCPAYDAKFNRCRGIHEYYSKNMTIRTHRHFRGQYSRQTGFQRKKRIVNQHIWRLKYGSKYLNGSIKHGTMETGSKRWQLLVHFWLPISYGQYM